MDSGKERDSHHSTAGASSRSASYKTDLDQLPISSISVMVSDGIGTSGSRDTGYGAGVSDVQPHPADAASSPHLAAAAYPAGARTDWTSASVSGTVPKRHQTSGRDSKRTSTDLDQLMVSSISAGSSSTTPWGCVRSVGPLSTSGPATTRRQPGSFPSSIAAASSAVRTPAFSDTPLLRARRPPAARRSGGYTRSTPRTAPSSVLRSAGGASNRSSLRAGTATPGASTPGDDLCPSTIVALAGGRGNAFGEVGIAALDLRSPCLILAQFGDSYTFSGVVKKIHVLNPCRILLPNTFCDGTKVIYNSLCGEFGEEMISPLARCLFRASVGVDRLTSLCLPSRAGLLHSLSNTYYCSAAAAALLEYLERVKSLTFRPRTLKIDLQSADSTVIIDCDTARRLELVVSARPERPQDSVFGAVRRTRTPGGSRRLRAELLQPSIDLQSIQSRLECVAELVANPELLYQLRAVVGRFQDVEKVHCFCIQQHAVNAYKNVEQRLNSVMALKSSLEVVEALRNSMEPAHNSMFVSLRSLLHDENLDAMLEKLRTVIHEDVQPCRSAVELRTLRCYAIKSRINGLLDVARRLYTETTDAFIGYVSALAEQHSLPLRPACSSSRGFHITASVPRRSRVVELPEELIQIQHKKDSYVFTTEKVMQLDSKADYTVNEICKMSNVIVCCLLDQLTQHLGFLYQLTEVVTTVDLMVNFADLALSRSLCRPEFGDAMHVRGGKHPLLSCVTSNIIVANDTVLNSDQRLMVLTGANMSGKSTYLKQIAILQILAQLGSFVPADSAAVPLVQRIFYRGGYEENMRLHLSAFTTEMQDMSRIVQEADECSLVLVDELGRGTAAEEGCALSWALCEQLMSRRCYAVVATHFQRLAQLHTLYYTSMVNYHLGVASVPNGDDSAPVQEGDRHRLYPGPLNCTGYGIRLAATTGIPTAVLDNARRILLNISSDDSGWRYDHSESAHGRLVYNLSQQLSELLNSCDVADQDPEEVRQRLKQLKRRFIDVQMSASSLQPEDSSPRQNSGLSTF